MSDPDADTIRRDFADAVNLTASELEKWLQTDESREVGMAGGEKKTSAGGGESVGHQMGRHIVDILHKKKADLTEEDLAHMKKVVGYVNRHRKQKPPKANVETSRWRYSLMNWGNDPLKEM